MSKPYLKVKREFLANMPDDKRHCVKCGSHWPLDLDHVLCRRLRPDLICEPSNFQILCWVCHKLKTRIEKRRWFNNDNFLKGEYDSC